MPARLIQSIAAEVPALDAAKMYGLRFGRSGRALCPWHSDHRPDLSFHGGRCRCFACGAGGDSVALTAQIFGLSMSAAAAKLATDFKCSGKVAPAPRPRVDAGRETWRTLCDVVRQADAELVKFAPKRRGTHSAFGKSFRRGAGQTSCSIFYGAEARYERATKFH